MNAQTISAQTVNAREQRGLELAEKVNIQPIGKGVGKWIVPSATGSGKYTVDLNSNHKRCDCPDYELRRSKCKHIFAVEFTVRKSVQSATNSKGETTVTETVTQTMQVTEVKKRTYRQDWPAYNAAQTAEKETLQVLLCDLCKGVPEIQQGFGHPRKPLGEMVFSTVFKVYSTVSSRRFMCDLADAQAKGYISKAPHFNTVLNYMEMAELTPILHELIRRSSEPLRAIECDFAVDSSGFSGSKFDTWFYEKYNANHQDFTEQRQRTDWLKLHLMCGVKTNIVTSVEVTGRNENDCPFLPQLVNDTATRFKLKEVSADKAYSSIDNLRTIAAHRAVPYVPFKSNSTGAGWKTGDKVGTGCDLWLSMWRYYTFHTDQFMAHYHKRSNVESTFSMIKGKFGNGLRSKGQTAQMNEVLCKVLCHNICCVIQSMHELGIEADFSPKPIA